MYSKKHRFPRRERRHFGRRLDSALMAKIVNHPPRKSPAAKPKRINLALQGGGAHGAFTWGGVLDYLLEDGRLEIAAISGTSAGAMNAVALADGYTLGGPEGAREKLHGFWQTMSEAAKGSPIKRAPIDVMMGYWSLDRSWGYQLMDAMTRMFSPYQLNPMDMNPLKDVLESCVDFTYVQSCHSIQLYISATNVETGRVKVFDSQSLTADMVMASACLPNIFKSVMIDGVPYWTVVTSATRRCFRSMPELTPVTSWWCRSIQSNAKVCREPHRKFRTASTRSASTPAFSRSYGPSISWRG